jgi:hypothetical protein
LSADTKFGGTMWWCTSMRFGLIFMSITLNATRFAHPSAARHDRTPRARAYCTNPHLTLANPQVTALQDHQTHNGD